MSIVTAAFHCPSELTFVDADDLLSIVHYSAVSKSNASRVNTVALDVVTGETHCDCRAAEFGAICWHQTLVQAAWEGSADVAYVARLSDAQLLTAGRKARAMCSQYRARCGRCLPDDQLLLVACVAVYRARQAARAVVAA